MGEAVFKHAGKTSARVEFPYTERGTRAIKRAESLSRKFAKRARRRGGARA